MPRKRKKYKFAIFASLSLCFESTEWTNVPKPQILEMGAGTGLFGVALATQTSEKEYVAVDVKADRLQVGAKKAIQQDLTNIRFLRARADQLPELLTASSYESIWVTFPDPFPKDRSAKHRLMHPQFLNIYKSLLRDDGALYFKTDAKNLFTWGLEQLVDEGWRIEELSFDLHGSTLADYYKIKTTYEAGYIEGGLNIHFVKATPPQLRG